jgi:hypothetical protein
MCDCISYNQPQPWQKTPSIVADPRDYFDCDWRPVSIDACIWPLIESLWKAGIVTMNSCCGHNDPVKRGVILEHESDADAAQTIADSMSDPAQILFWKLVTKDMVND